MLLRLTTFDAAQWATWLVNLQEYRLTLVAGCILLFYDWVLVSDREYELIHKAPWSTVKIAFFLCRYYPILSYSLIIWGYGLNHDYDTCGRIWQGIHAIHAPMKFLPEGVMLLRAYTFSGRRRGALIVLFPMYIALVSVTIWVFCTPTPLLPQHAFEFLGGLGCFPDYTVSVFGKRLATLMACTMTMDLASLLVVIVHSYQVYHGGSLASYFVKQGLSSFAYVAIANIIASVLYFRMGTYIGLVFTLVIPSLLACRIILNLRELAQTASRGPTVSQLERSTIGYLDSHILDDWTVDNQTRFPRLSILR